MKPSDRRPYMLALALTMTACSEPSYVVPPPDCDAPGVLGFEFADDGTRINRCLGPGPYQTLGLPDGLNECDPGDPHTLIEACGYNGHSLRPLSCEPWQWSAGGWSPCQPGEPGCHFRRFGLLCGDDDPALPDADRDQCRLGDLKPVVLAPDEDRRASVPYDRVDLYVCREAGDVAQWRRLPRQPVGWFDLLLGEDHPFACPHDEIEALRQQAEYLFSGEVRLECEWDDECRGFSEGGVCLAGRCWSTSAPWCLEGTARAIEVGLNGRGLAWQVCRDERFHPDHIVCGALRHPDAADGDAIAADRCVDGSSRIARCGQGWHYDTCIEGEWREGPCLPPCPEDGPCVAGTCHRLMADGEDGSSEEHAVCVLPACDNGLLDPGEVTIDVGGRCGDIGDQALYETGHSASQ